MSLNFKDDQDLENFFKTNPPTPPIHSAKREDEFKRILLNVQQYKRSKRNKTIGTFSGIMATMLCLVIVIFPSNKSVNSTGTIAPRASMVAAIPNNTNETVDKDENNYYPAINVGAEYLSILADEI